MQTTTNLVALTGRRAADDMRDRSKTLLASSSSHGGGPSRSLNVLHSNIFKHIIATITHL